MVIEYETESMSVIVERVASNGGWRGWLWINVPVHQQFFSTRTLDLDLGLVAGNAVEVNFSSAGQQYNAVLTFQDEGWAHRFLEALGSA